MYNYFLGEGGGGAYQGCRQRVESVPGLHLHLKMLSLS